MRGAIHLYIKAPKASPGGPRRSPFVTPRSSPGTKSKRFGLGGSFVNLDLHSLVPDLEKREFD